ncbi:HesA/MoeB/ThiF family protein [Croceivirga thetidis]|uniref:Sulfurtransferase n=1 Tax=Croceivirga thetidis TaxID=2721623 RepID=A0ABX1GTD5_9FLAO|nr:HesA/MoeB/ThiF family protein [Croceivirga thetidis]NKI32306.1 sulfurtransferase [Croceivirga thetidis]
MTNRYIRHTSLSSFGVQGQTKLSKASILIVGLGGLGIPAAQYLNAMGVGEIGLVENDIIALHNLQRQVLYSENDIGKSKLDVTLHKLQEQNQSTAFKTFDAYLTPENALEIIAQFDLVIDATDNFESRYLINDACVILDKPFVYGALHAFEGQISVFNFEEGPTYRCLFPVQPGIDEIPNCDDNGVLGILPGIIGSLQALEAVKVITGIGAVLSGKLLLFDGLSQTTQKINFNLNPINKGISHLKESYHATSCTNIKNISAEEFIEISERESIQIIDVRSDTEFGNGYWKGAKNIPLSDIDKRLEEFDFNDEIYLLCQSGIRSQKAYELLTTLRPSAKLINVAGGMNNLELHVGSN